MVAQTGIQSVGDVVEVVYIPICPVYGIDHYIDMLSVHLCSVSSDVENSYNMYQSVLLHIQ